MTTGTCAGTTQGYHSGPAVNPAWPVAAGTGGGAHPQPAGCPSPSSSRPGAAPLFKRALRRTERRPGFYKRLPLISRLGRRLPLSLSLGSANSSRCILPPRREPRSWKTNLTRLLDRRMLLGCQGNFPAFCQPNNLNLMRHHGPILRGHYGLILKS